MSSYSGLSLWFDTLPEPIVCRPPLDGSATADICILGAGYTGLWTAYYLKRKDPSLRIIILEAETAGFGASGRNGGWVSGTMANSARYFRSLPAERRRFCRQVLFGMVDEVAGIIGEHGIQCGFHKGGALHAAAGSEEQLADLEAYAESARELGYSEGDLSWLGREEAEQRIRMHGIRAALFFPHCAVIDPAALARALAGIVERMGVTLCEKTRVRNIERGLVATEQGNVRAAIIVPALEGYSNRIAPLGAYLVPVHSLIVATEPLDDAAWSGIGLGNREAFDDCSRQVTYGQRTSDRRMVFGARGTYLFGGRRRERWPLDHPAMRARVELLFRLFPQLRGTRITHAWGGAFGMARAMTPHMVLDRAAGLAWAGGYSGEGVAMANLAGRTLSDLVLDRRSELVSMPWVFTDTLRTAGIRRWEPEPLRWAGFMAATQLFRLSDALCRSGAPHWSRRLSRYLAGFVQKLMLS